MIIQGVVEVSSCTWCHWQGQDKVRVLDDDDASFTRLKVGLERSNWLGST
jgi:hypothetical protein